MRTLTWAVVLVVAGAGACTGADGTGSSGSSSGGSSSSSGAAGRCPTPGVLACSDTLIQDLNLKTTVNTGLIVNSGDATTWTSDIDATAGGAFATNPPSYIYARFTDAGMERVDIHDQAALDSMDWDIAFRRYVVRINSADSGPSCVEAMRLGTTATFEGITTAAEVPTNLPWRVDDIQGDDCTLVSDSSGLPASPNTALSSYYAYPGCVQMTGNIYVLHLADGRYVKFVVDRFYNEAAQAECQSAGAVTSMPTGSGNFRVRWAFLP